MNCEAASWAQEVRLQVAFPRHFHRSLPDAFGLNYLSVKHVATGRCPYNSSTPEAPQSARFLGTPPEQGHGGINLRLLGNDIGFMIGCTFTRAPTCWRRS
jgi:hypothetical protein